MLKLLPACVLLSIAALPGHAQSGDIVERSTHLRYGQPNGFQEVRRAADGTISVHFEYEDRGRGPKFDARYRLAADGTPLQVDVEGVDYLKAPLSDRYSLADGQARWQNAAENEQRAVHRPVFYKSFYSPTEEFHLLVQTLLKAPGQKLDLLPGGEVGLRKLGKETVRGKAGTRTLFLYAVSGFGAPTYFWQDAGGRFFVDSGSMVPEGWEDILPRLRKVEEEKDKQLHSDRAAALTRRLDRVLAIEHVRVFDPDGLAVKTGRPCCSSPAALPRSVTTAVSPSRSGRNASTAMIVS